MLQKIRQISLIVACVTNLCILGIQIVPVFFTPTQVHAADNPLIGLEESVLSPENKETINRAIKTIASAVISIIMLAAVIVLTSSFISKQITAARVIFCIASIILGTIALAWVNSYTFVK